MHPMSSQHARRLSMRTTAAPVWKERRRPRAMFPRATRSEPPHCCGCTVEPMGRRPGGGLERPSTINGAGRFCCRLAAARYGGVGQELALPEMIEAERGISDRESQYHDLPPRPPRRPRSNGVSVHLRTRPESRSARAMSILGVRTKQRGEASTTTVRTKQRGEASTTRVRTPGRLYRGTERREKTKARCACPVRTARDAAPGDGHRGRGDGGRRVEHDGPWRGVPGMWTLVEHECTGPCRARRLLPAPC
ncbi:hypothetical protein BC628DRAFT_1074032 [Trametes gibbosa]|nr:hypothetical protein BC628DRAFT_1074032 [Trametes gibbosa]